MTNSNEVYKVQLPKLHKGQLKIFKEIKSGEAFFYVLCNSRQFGKTFLLEWIMLFYALKNSNKKLYFISHYYAQAKKSYKSIQKAIAQSGLVKTNSHTELIINLTNGSELYFKGADNYESLRGISPNFLFIDEFQFLKKAAWTEVLRPSLNVAGINCFLASTPRSKLSEFYKLFLLGLNKENKLYKSFHATYKDNPLANLSEVEDARKNVPTQIFNSEYLALFLEGEGEVFQNIDVASCLEFSNIKDVYYAGLDTAKQVDFTVLTIMNQKHEVVFIYRTNRQDWQDIIFEIAKYLKQYNVKKCLIETNAGGDVVFDMLKKQVGNILEPFTTTSQSKNKIIEQLSVAFQNFEIKIPKQEVFPFLYQELNLFAYTYNAKTRSVKYGAPQGHHDDCVMSLALAEECTRKNRTSGHVSFHKVGTTSPSAQRNTSNSF